MSGQFPFPAKFGSVFVTGNGPFPVMYTDTLYVGIQSTFVE